MVAQRRSKAVHGAQAEEAMLHTSSWLQGATKQTPALRACDVRKQ